MSHPNTERDDRGDVPGRESVVWKPLFNGIFEASSDGRIRRVIKTRYNQKLGEIALSGGPSYRYLKCGLILNGKLKRFSVHRLILLAFRGPCPIGMEGAHLNGNAKDNRIENLVYKTKLENEGDKTAHGTRPQGEHVSGSRLTAGKVRLIRSDLRRGIAAIKLAEQYGVHPSTINQIRRGKTWRHVK